MKQIKVSKTFQMDFFRKVEICLLCLRWSSIVNCVIKENGEEEREDVERVVVRGEGSQVQASAAFILHIL